MVTRLYYLGPSTFRTTATGGGKQQSNDNDRGGGAALDEIRQCRSRGLVLIEQGLACEEATPSDQRDIRPNPMAKSLYKRREIPLIKHARL